MSERDTFLEHMENRSACCEYDEPEPEVEVLDRLHAALEQAWTMLGTTCVGQIQEPSR